MAEKSETYGRYLINQHLPEEHKLRGPVTKSAFKKSMMTYAHQNPEAYAESIEKIKHEGDRIATLEGLTIGLDDITPDYAKRKKMMAPHIAKFKAANTDEKRKDAAIGAHTALMDLTDKHPGSLTLQVKSGARGNMVGYNNLVGGVGYVRDFDGNPIPWLVEKTYSEGLKPADYWATTGQSMKDQIASMTSVSEPGELAKKLVVNMSDQVITEDDCGTTNGLEMDASSPDVIDRYLARGVHSFKHNTLITPNNQPAIAKLSARILVRSPMTCEAPDGVCKHCQGLDERGNLHHKGINVGIRSAQAMAEPLTQFALSAKHGGHTAKSDKQQVQGIKGFRAIIETPENFENRAILSEVEGKVTKVEVAPQGGHFVTVEKTRHYIEPGLDILVKKDAQVSKGDRLSEGIIRPTDITRLKGLDEGRRYMVSSLHNLYKGQGMNMDPRHFELLAKSVMSHALITDDNSPHFLKGDTVSYNALRKVLREDTKQLPTKAAIGETLGIAYPGYTAGTHITHEVSRKLIEKGIDQVIVSPRAPGVEFVMMSATSAPKKHSDWIARMAHQGLKRSIMQAAAYGEESNIHGTHPVPAYTYGVEFGEGEDGRY
jgi:DNA-directed RNA polymerase subunit beta'